MRLIVASLWAWLGLVSSVATAGTYEADPPSGYQRVNADKLPSLILDEHASALTATLHADAYIAPDRTATFAVITWTGVGAGKAASEQRLIALDRDFIGHDPTARYSSDRTQLAGDQLIADSALIHNGVHVRLRRIYEVDEAGTDHALIIACVSDDGWPTECEEALGAAKFDLPGRVRIDADGWTLTDDVLVLAGVALVVVIAMLWIIRGKTWTPKVAAFLAVVIWLGVFTAWAAFVRRSFAGDPFVFGVSGLSKEIMLPVVAVIAYVVQWNRLHRSSVMILPHVPLPRATARPPAEAPPPVVHDHALRGKLTHALHDADLSPAGIDARREDGAAVSVLWRDIVAARARRAPADLQSTVFVDVVSVVGETMRFVPWTRITGETITLASADQTARALLGLVAARCPQVELDAPTRAFLDGGVAQNENGKST